MRSVLAPFWLILALSTAMAAEGLPSTPFRLDAYQSFVANWAPQDQPLCAAIGSAEQWRQVMRPAAVMGNRRPFAPPESFWTSHALLVTARVVPASGGADPFHFGALTRNGAAVAFSYGFAPPPAADAAVKASLAVVIAKPLPVVVRFRENGQPVCALEPARGHWVSPPNAGAAKQ